VLRGGSWGDIVKYGSGRTTRRTGFPPDNEYSILGFRPAK
jgi:formylglycine-generating enzyme required for sulfatase activity